MNLLDFNEEFFPTPPELIEKMLSGIDLKSVQDILEPSAGKGDIAEAIVKRMDTSRYEHTGFHKQFVDCIELDSNLRALLTGKKFRVVHDDFLTYRTQKKYDLIVMNPPFSNGDEHLIHALSLAKHGCTVVCLLNAETLRNCYTDRRKMLMQQLNSLDAEIEYQKNAFSSAERKTDVDIAIVKVRIPAAETESFIFSNLKKKAYTDTDYECEELASGNFFEQIVKSYEIEVEAGVQLINEYKAMVPHMLCSFDDSKYNTPILDMKVGGHDVSVNEYVRKVRDKYWTELFQNKKFTGCLTSNLQEELMDKVRTLRDYDFSLFNIQCIQQEISAMMRKGVEETIINLFDKLSRKHSWYPESENNIHYYNGWASNKAHCVNSKVILPINGFSSWKDYSNYTEKFEAYQISRELTDLQRAFDYLDNGETEEYSSVGTTLKNYARMGITKKIPLKYFSVTLFKKGTCHISFYSQKLLDRLNIFGSQHKGWLPPCYGKKHYRDMTQEEQAVIADFQGEEAYERVMANPSQYIIEPPQLMMLEEKTA